MRLVNSSILACQFRATRLALNSVQPIQIHQQLTLNLLSLGDSSDY